MNDLDWDHLPQTTMPPSTTVQVVGFDNEEGANALGEAVLAVVSLAGSFIDLSSLDGVTVAIDYDGALAELDRGLPGLRPLTRSNTEEMQGVAMSPAVMRDGEVRTHIVLNAQMVAPSVAEQYGCDSTDKPMSVGIIAHECAHVQITAEKERLVPDARFGNVIEGYEHAVMFQIAEVLWDEYAACRLSGMFARQQNEAHASTVMATVVVARDRSDDAIRRYRTHGNVDLLIVEAGPPLCAPVKAAAYLLGGMDADGLDWSNFKAVRNALEQAGYADLIDNLYAELRRLWQTRSEWSPTLDVFSGLEAIAHEVFASGGLFFSTNEAGGCWVDVP
ncbi:MULTISPECIES: hypothetical protein [unclassified Sphingomonas]|uniref:hypothetical protein n=1 Tax=unclassified Sphingomonas TaxID=196159 RepID=UPI00226A3472|nr:MULTISPECIES: hypothetical protein [unclassified Sphingomonas]